MTAPVEGSPWPMTAGDGMTADSRAYASRIVGERLDRVNARADETPARYVCKGCGAESPTGIGYVAGSGRVSFPDPDPACPNPHVDGSPRLPFTLHRYAPSGACKDHGGGGPCVTTQSLVALAGMVETRGREPLRDALATIHAALSAGQTVRITVEGDR